MKYDYICNVICLYMQRLSTRNGYFSAHYQFVDGYLKLF